MSLRTVHISFILLSIGLLLGFAYWEFTVNRQFFNSAVWFVLAILLGAYLVWFISKDNRPPTERRRWRGSQK